MANRTVGNTYIIDTGSANTAIPWNAGARIESVSVWFSASNGALTLADANTANTLLRIVHDGGNNRAKSYNYYLGVCVDNLTVPVLTSGTAWIYLA